MAKSEAHAKEIETIAIPAAIWWEESPPVQRTTATPITPLHYHEHSDTKNTEDTKRDAELCCYKAALSVCAFLLPPLGVFLQTGCDKNLIINILLTIIGSVQLTRVLTQTNTQSRWVPGIIHALFVILTTKRPFIDSNQQTQTIV